jgi:8-oxo-dGTP pyrophosphatase MutT (NUDIX family)
VWLMRRHAAMAFAAGMQAFPGGAVEPVDHDEQVPHAGGDADGFAAALGLDDVRARALASAAVRETFEECGVLVARAAPPEPEPARRALLDGSLGWADLLRGAGVAVDVALLVPWSRWVTPDWSPRRFDAYFFLAALPADQQPRWIDGEADRADWSSAREAVARHERGELPMLPPTIATLRDLARFDDVASALAAGPARIPEEVG